MTQDTSFATLSMRLAAPTILPVLLRYWQGESASLLIALFIALSVVTPRCLSAPTTSGQHAAPPPVQADTAVLRASLGELPSDQQMIEHFRTNRATFSEVIRLYQTDKYAARAMLGVPQLGDASKYRDLLHTIGIARLSYDGAAWLPDPYSADVL